ncbi:PX-associated-domain-containing protein [Staphylotrichum tortipilum]|uniref:PX-associated-domain-containing protein n=1 Tax=Staphylotrichum tortipilum TaxID=2831512 RepID=A0AAN6RX05_9PEZI|nr:PX-associated-domain-containing protein [Staphylotrichum longicolle]
MDSRGCASENAADDATPSPTPAVSVELTPSQLHALFDILTHHETYAEVESFKDPRTISEYGYPFARHALESNSAPSYATESAAPLLAGVLRSIVLPFPGVPNLPAEFWHGRFQTVLEKLAEAELSESYDKAALGIRKTLATVASAVHEAVSRGILGGVVQGAKRDLHREYNRSKAEDLSRAWDDVVQEIVYGNLVEGLFAVATEKKSLEEHSPGVQAAADYIILHLATLIHRVFVLSPEGRFLLKLLESLHQLLPYTMIKQTLRIGNAATMINGMMRLLLAKLSMGSLSNWVGLTQNADNGVNLLQRIIGLVLSWDALEFRRSAQAIEKAKAPSSPSKQQLAAIRDYLKKPRAEHEETRQASSQKAQSMVVTILERSNPNLLPSLSEAQHGQCLEYLSALLAARDRDEITNALCRQNPDLFTQALKDIVAAFDPMIRTTHQRVDLREHVSAAEGFITEFINVSKGKKAPGSSTANHPKGATSETRPPSVEDYVLLLRNNRQLLYNWLHQLASQCPDIRADFLTWAKATISLFRQAPHPPEQPPPTTTLIRPGAAGALSTPLQALFTALPSSTQSLILSAIDAHAAYLDNLESLSLARMQRILDNMSTSPSAPSSTTTTTTQPRPPTTTTPTQPRASTSLSGPGMYLSRWQQLLDDTVIASASSHGDDGGALRQGRDVKGLVARGRRMSFGAATGKGGWDRGVLGGVLEGEERESGEPESVDVRGVVEALGEGFRRLVGGFVRGEEGGGREGGGG